MWHQQVEWEEPHKGRCAIQAAMILLLFAAALGLGVDWSLADKQPPPSFQVTLTQLTPNVPKAITPKPAPKVEKPKPKVAVKEPPKVERKPQKPKPEPKPKPKPKAEKVKTDIALKRALEEEELAKKREEEKRKAEEKKAAWLEKLRKNAQQQEELEKRKKKEKQAKKQVAKKEKPEPEEVKNPPKVDEAERKAAEQLFIDAANERAQRQAQLDNLKRSYVSRIISRIESYLVTPLEAQSINNLQVVIEVEVDASGGLIGQPQIAESSGVDEYDKEAVRAVLQAAPLPMPKEEELVSEFKFLRLHISPR